MRKTENSYVKEWLRQHNVVLAESFADVLMRMAKEYKKAYGIRTLSDIYQKIGVSKECLYYWKQNPYGAQTKKIQI